MSRHVQPPKEESYQRLAPDDTSGFEEFFALYLASMPKSERKSKLAMQALVRRPDYRLVLLRQFGRLIGYSVTFAPEYDNFCLLEYMAVDAACRNRGIGSKLFQHTADLVRASRSGITLLLEVDSDRDAAPDRQLRKRRQTFYQRLGCLRVDRLKYLLPLDTGTAPPEMDLMLLLAAGDTVIRRADLAHWLRVIYEQVYGQSPADPRIEQMVDAVDDPVKLVEVRE